MSGLGHDISHATRGWTALTYCSSSRMRREKIITGLVMDTNHAPFAELGKWFNKISSIEPQLKKRYEV